MGGDVKDEVALFLGDIIYNARSSFDILAYSLLLDSGLTPTRRTYYPFIGIDSDLQTKLLQTGLDALPSHHLNFFGTHPPSKTSNLALYASHVLVIVDKHRTIAPVAAYVEIEQLVVSSSSVPMGFGRIRTPWAMVDIFLAAFRVKYKILSSAVAATRCSQYLMMIWNLNGRMFFRMRRIASLNKQHCL